MREWDRQHRRTIVTALGDGSREIEFTRRALEFDDKNYHTWAYRQWALSHFFSSRPEAEGEGEDEGVWEGERVYTGELLRRDARNNSAWNHRFFVEFESGYAQARGKSVEVGEREIK
jgi:protein farnesyltransferase/geranylgeranyltransferase type-1 subunit alpha